MRPILLIFVFATLFCGCTVVRTPGLMILAANNTPLPGHARITKYVPTPLAIPGIEVNFEVDHASLDELSRCIKDGLAQRGWGLTAGPDSVIGGDGEPAQRAYTFRRACGEAHTDAEELEVAIWDQKDGKGPLRVHFQFRTRYPWEEPNRTIFMYVTGGWYEGFGSLSPGIGIPLMIITAVPVCVLAYSL